MNTHIKFIFSFMLHIYEIGEREREIFFCKFDMSFKPFKYKHSFIVMYYTYKNLKYVVGSCK
jgi:hypothetical protein